MGKIYYIMGKSAVGKDTIYSKLSKQFPTLKKIVLYTTRPKRSTEIEGFDYHFVSEESLENFQKDNKVIEKRIYDTMYGKWAYATIDDASIDLKNNNYIAIGTLESYIKIKDYFGKDNIFPIYISLPDIIRFERAFEREKSQASPKIDEMCRRYLADEKDFSEENLSKAGIDKFYINDNLHECLNQIKKDMGLNYA